MIEHRCQPEPDRPFSIEREAAASSRCIGCGSNSAANASISSRVTWRGPKLPKWPGGKSSKVRVMMGIAGGRPDCGRYLRQSQPADPAWPGSAGEHGSSQSVLRLARDDIRG